MKITYVVHSAVKEMVDATVSFKGREIIAKVPALVVELVGVDHKHSHTFTSVPSNDEEMQALVELFALGANISATFTPAD